MSITPSAEIVERVLAGSRADELVAIVSETTQANLRWAHNTLTTNGQMHDRTLTVVAIRRDGDGSCSGVVTSRFGTEAEAIAIREAAEAAAAAASPAEDAMPLLTDGTDPDFTTAAEPTSIDVLSGFAAGLADTFDEARGRSVSLFGFAEHIATTTWLGTSSGIRRRHVQPTGRLELNAKDPSMRRSAWLGRGTRDFTDIDVTALWPELRQRYDWTERSIELPAGRYETLLPPSAVADLMIYLYWTASWRDAAEGRSVFAAPGGGTRIGERLATLPITLWSDPGHPGLQGSPFTVACSSGGGTSSVYDNGLPVGREDWLRDGVLNELIATRAVGEQSGRGAHPGSDNLIMDAGGSGRLTDLVGATDNGLLLTCLWYIREVDPESLLLTGLTRDGVYQVSGGEVTGVVNNFRFNESPVDLLRRVTEASATEIVLPREWNDWFSRTSMPALRVPDFNMSTVSQAS
ncbi:metallopeptidase TldD-related protein [Microlunatus sp. Y2014]|uniref:metallopeptidase TldD-related protein n=1 Tax=Microlunatus sp. Y2014 TaxID=3418488 RepID=UPI003DA7A29D